MHILTIVGARPQFVKAAVFSRFIRENDTGITETLVHTGQHYDQNMSEVFFDEMDIPLPDVNLHVGSGSHGKMTGAMLSSIEELCLEQKPDALLVYGDTNSTLAGALAASKLHIPIIHVEAGLRSYMLAMPEEQNRRLTDHLSTWLFCPTQTAVGNLEKENIADSPATFPTADQKRVCMSGDIMYDAALYYSKNNPVQMYEHGFILVTIHRAENTDNPERLKAIVQAINALSDKEFILPLHPRTKKRLLELDLSFGPHVMETEPLGYLEMIAYEEASSAILTDSGGVQKEAYFFNKPCITMRDTTEWVELVNCGWNTLTGSDTQKIITAIQSVTSPATHPNFYGTGNCAKTIARILESA